MAKVNENCRTNRGFRARTPVNDDLPDRGRLSIARHEAGGASPDRIDCKKLKNIRSLLLVIFDLIYVACLW
jgi:hypothetical protein